MFDCTSRNDASKIICPNVPTFWSRFASYWHNQPCVTDDNWLLSDATIKLLKTNTISCKHKVSFTLYYVQFTLFHRWEWTCPVIAGFPTENKQIVFISTWLSTSCIREHAGPPYVTRPTPRRSPSRGSASERPWAARLGDTDLQSKCKLLLYLQDFILLIMIFIHFMQTTTTSSTNTNNRKPNLRCCRRCLSSDVAAGSSLCIRHSLFAWLRRFTRSGDESSEADSERDRRRAIGEREVTGWIITKRNYHTTPLR